MVARVYVSSTVADLRAERAAVFDWLRLARHQAVDSYLPDSDTVRDSCLADVAACDLYVLIAGHRSGFQPLEDNPEGLSITQLEFRRAGEAGIPRVALLRTSVPDVRLSDLQDPARAPLVWAFREEVAAGVRAAEFADLQGLVQGLSTGVQGELAKLDKREQQQAGHGPAGLALRVAPRPVFLAGREELLADLDARLAEDTGGPRVAVLYGLGGAGKTSVAVEYAHRHLDGVDVCWQFAAEDPALLAAEFGVLAAQLGAREAADPRDPVASVHGVLARAETPWLVVFDNASDRASVGPFVPPAGPGRVLITTQNQIWPPGQAVDVPVLDPVVAADFLVSRTGDADGTSARELAGQLGGLPLALEQAAAYVQATGTTLARYLLLFRDRQADLLARGEVAGHPDMAATLGLALSRLAAQAPAAAGLVRLLAFLAPEPVPLAVLLAGDAAANQLGAEAAAAVGGLLGDPVAAGDAIAALRRYSLVTPAGDGLVLVHRLVQAITRAQLPAEEAARWAQAAAALVETAVPAESWLPAAWPVCAVLLPHARAVLDLTSGGIGRIAEYLGASGSYPAARDLFQLIVDAHTDSDAYGPEHPDTLSARHDLAYWTGRAGDAAGARDQLAALLPVRERILGAEHPDTLATRNQLAIWTGVAGDAAGARDQSAALLPAVERVLGAEYPDTLVTRTELARWTGNTGDAAGARDQFAVLLPAAERVLGAEHPGTLSARASLASWTGQAGDAAGACDQFAILLPLFERVLGPEHPDTLDTRHELASWTGAAGDAAGARDQFAALLPVRERVLGPEHPDTLSTRGHLTYWIGAAGDAVGARDQFAALLPLFERVLGPEHPETLSTRGNLALLIGAAGDAAGARDQFAALLPLFERVLGPEHPDTLTARGNLARWTRRAGDAAPDAS
jgi:hypothetical protein